MAVVNGTCQWLDIFLRIESLLYYLEYIYIRNIVDISTITSISTSTKRQFGVQSKIGNYSEATCSVSIRSPDVHELIFALIM